MATWLKWEPDTLLLTTLLTELQAIQNAVTVPSWHQPAEVTKPLNRGRRFLV
jgi:hypothetical protein